MGEGFSARPIPVILDPRILLAEIEYVPYCYRRDSGLLCTLSQTLCEFLALCLSRYFTFGNISFLCDFSKSIKKNPH
jgi:hypothetical protein